MKTVRAIIHGRVQGVGYRAWTAAEAKHRGVQGWVRNLKDGMVEALFHGSEEQVDTMLAACKRGPFLAKVSKIDLHDAQDTPTGFVQKETV